MFQPSLLPRYLTAQVLKQSTNLQEHICAALLVSYIPAHIPALPTLSPTTIVLNRNTEPFYF